MALFGRGRDVLPSSPDKQAAALQAAMKVSEIASSAVPLADAVRAIVGSAVEILSASEGSIMLLDDSGATLSLVAAHGLPPEVALGSTLPIGESIAGRVLATGRPLRVEEVDRDAFVNFVPKSRAITSSLVVPLRVHSRAIGVLSLATSSDAKFTDDDLKLAQMYGDQAAGLIHRARLHEHAEQRSSDLMLLVDASKGLLGTLDLDELLQRVLDGGARLAGSSDGFACLFDPETGALSTGMFRGVDKPVIRTLLENPALRKSVDLGDAAVLEKVSGRDWVSFGLRTQRGTSGVLVIPAERHVVTERMDLLRAFAHQCGSAIGSAELHTEVRRKESELGSIILGVPNPIILIDARQRIVAVNPAAENILGVATIFSSGVPVEGSLGNEEVERFLIGDGEVQGEVVIGTPPRVYKVRVTDVQVPGAPMGRVLIMDDITTEREIVQMQRDFVAMIGHELRTPLTIIKGFARTLMRRLEKASTDEAHDALATIDAKAEQLEHLIEDLLYVSKIESREAALRIELVDVTTLIKSVGQDVVQSHSNRELTVDVKPELMWPCDETKLGLVLRHLVENALKYSEAPGAVVVKATDDGDCLRVEVSDKGAGIVSTDIPHIFDRFRQVDSSATREHGGTGVGLYLCAQLVRVHGGRIWVDSTWGKGSTFTFTLPRQSVQGQVVKILPQARERSA